MIAAPCAPSRTEFALAWLRGPREASVLCAAFARSAAQLAAGICEANTMSETWTQERVDQLRSYITAGLTCSQIADEIGVTRNAVIGKIHRLGIGPGRTAAAPARPRPPGVRRPRFSQRNLLRVVYAQAPRVAETTDVEPAPIESAQRCSLLELAHGKCRWPLSDPAKADFAFCGNDSIAGLSYCAGHARMAYRFPARRRA